MVSNALPGVSEAERRLRALSVSQRVQRIALLAIIVEALGLLIIGQRSMMQTDSTRLWLGTWTVGLAVLILLDQLLAHAIRRKSKTAHISYRFLSPRRWATVALVLPLASYVFFHSYDPPINATKWSYLGPWVALMLISLAIIAWPIQLPTVPAIKIWANSHRYEILLVSSITAAAFILRFYDLANQAWWFSGDEGKFAGTAREVIQGKLQKPFETTFDAHALLWVFVQGGVMRIFGDDIRGARMLSCLIGTATIPLFYLLLRRQFGKLAGTVGTVLLATSHFHIFMSRDAMNNISAPFFLVLTLLLLDQLLESWRPAKAFFLGLMLGLAQYAYVTNRLIIPIILTVFVLALVLHRPRSRVQWLVAAQSLTLIALGAALAYLPQAAYFLVHPENFNARLKAVSVFGSGWLEHEREITGNGTLPILWHQLELAILLPYTTNPSGYYQIDPPFIGWPLVIPAAIGTATITANALRFRFAGWAVAIWAVTVGLSLTIGSPEINRFAFGGLIMPLTATIGLLSIATLLRRLVGVPRPLILGGLAGFLVLSAFWNVRVAFEEDPAVNRPLDRNSIASTQFAKEMHQLGAGYSIYFLAAPQMYFDGLPNLRYLAEGDEGIDVEQPWTLADAPPDLTGPTYFFFVPERRNEVDVVKTWFPNGAIEIHRDSKGDELYITYFVDPGSAPDSG